LTALIDPRSGEVEYLSFSPILAKVKEVLMNLKTGLRSNFISEVTINLVSLFKLTLMKIGLELKMLEKCSIMFVILKVLFLYQVI
jgi:hypothetical protein